MCACVCGCVCVCVRVRARVLQASCPRCCRLRASPLCPAPRPASQAEGGAETARARSSAYPRGQGGSAGTAAPRSRHTPPATAKKKVRLQGLPLSGWPLEAEKRARRLSLRGAAGSQHPASRLPELVERGRRGGGGILREGDPGADGPCRGAHLGATHPGGSGPSARVRGRSGS